MNFIPEAAKKLTEQTSIDLVKKIQQIPILTPLTTEAILTTYVRQGNEGTPILLLHGFDSSVLEFRRLIPILAAEKETIAVDLLGFGFSDRLPGLSFNPEAIKIHLYHFWQETSQKPVILVGASMGGAVAIDFSIAYPEAVTKLVLLDSAGLAKPPSQAKLMFPPLDSLATAFLRNPRVRQNIARAAYYDKSLASVDAAICAALHLNCNRWSEALISFAKSGGYGNMMHKLKDISQPTLIIWGEDDRVLGTKDPVKFEKAIPDNKLIWIAQCGHVPHLEKPEITARLILQL